jgi:adenosylmethionine-8-amino-7-oxononanoate aminotransferase
MKTHERLPLLPIERAEGPWLYAPDGRRVFDAISSWWVNLFGHAHPAIVAAIEHQLRQLDHVMLAGFTHRPAVALAERLSALCGGELGHVFFASDGASATEIALKMSAHYWRNLGHGSKSGFVSLAGSYHGETIGALGVTDVALFRDAYRDLIRPALTAPTPDARQAPTGEAAAEAAARGLEALLARHHEEIAALIVEPLVQCAGGFAMHDPSYLRAARALCDRYQVHLIYDEIAVGFGRTGTLFAHEQAGPAARPDFLCLSKGITGGTLPLSVVLTRDAVFQAFYDDDAARGFLHSHSYSGNPPACAAALAVLDLFERDEVLVRNREGSRRLTAALAPIATAPRCADFRNRGMIWAFEVPDAPADFAPRCFAAGLANGILLRPLGKTVYLMPPYLLDEANCAYLAERLAASLEAVFA